MMGVISPSRKLSTCCVCSFFNLHVGSTCPSATKLHQLLSASPLWKLTLPSAVSHFLSALWLEVVRRKISPLLTLHNPSAGGSTISRDPFLPRRNSQETNSTNSPSNSSSIFKNREKSSFLLFNTPRTEKKRMCQSACKVLIVAIVCGFGLIGAVVVATSLVLVREGRLYRERSPVSIHDVIDVVNTPTGQQELGRIVILAARAVDTRGGVEKSFLERLVKEAPTIFQHKTIHSLLIFTAQFLEHRHPSPTVEF